MLIPSAGAILYTLRFTLFLPCPMVNGAEFYTKSER